MYTDIYINKYKLNDNKNGNKYTTNGEEMGGLIFEGLPFLTNEK